jgi:glycosyltransferase involved in cell wall biosynthesis
VARVEHPGKNHLNLLKAYERLPQEIKAEYNLVCAGGFKERSSEVLAYKDSSAERDKINFTGFFPKEDLIDLYKNAALFVMPSFFEGFGIPLVEAMACNIPVISSDRGPLPEVVGQGALLFDPEQPAEIAKMIEKVLSDEQMRKELIDKGRARLKFFQWSLHCEKIIQLYKEKEL